ncbi:hypothetical protein KR100_04095 [Synechococcus sp. KORDI-100]|uniref:hypothetical protein n=1 Tax=Synechococcus sp. KORDI-100 TaxID=1280380 RepID=UPI0004E0A6E4|nr:hypothetical protein [Synechococcus sp. KORDI-100]AII42548.1 hypothetical protein KR100_04095 [Synechococcus sp. KORDI-100]
MDGKKTVRDMVNVHLPILLQLISTLSLVVIAFSATCISSSLKEISGQGEMATNASASDATATQPLAGRLLPDLLRLNQ